MVTMNDVRPVTGDIPVTLHVVVTVLVTIATGSVHNVGRDSGDHNATSHAWTLVVTVAIGYPEVAMNVWTDGVPTVITHVKLTLFAQYANKTLGNVHNAATGIGDQRANIHAQARATQNVT